MVTGNQVARVAVGVAATGIAAFGAEKLFGGPLRDEAGSTTPDNGLAHIGAAALSLGPGAALIRSKAVSTPFLREAMIGASLGAGVALAVTGVIEGYRGITKTDFKFLVPTIATD